MVNEKEIENEKYIKQLEKENKLLKQRILLNEFRNYNGEILKLKFNIKNLESEIDYWKDKAYYYKLLLSFK